MLHIFVQLVVFDDNFVKRGKGSRIPGLGKDSALGEYMKYLKFPQVIIYHNKFSPNCAVFPLFAMKTLSRYLGGNSVRYNADKVILVEKDLAIEIFGQGPGVYALRSKYYLTYTGLALTAGIRDPALLDDYGKKELLCFGREGPMAIIENRLLPPDTRSLLP